MCKLIKPPMFHNIEGFEPINSIKDYNFNSTCKGTKIIRNRERFKQKKPTR